MLGMLRNFCLVKSVHCVGFWQNGGLGSQKMKQLKRSGKAFEESPSPDPHMLTPESSSNGLTSATHSQVKPSRSGMFSPQLMTKWLY